MEKDYFRLSASALLLFGLTVVLSHLMRERPTADRFLIPPPENIELWAFGFSESFADSLWLRWIQDADNCQTYLAPVRVLPEYAKNAIVQDRRLDTRHKICDGSWSFKMLEAVTGLAPNFKMPYTAGGISLAVLTEDYAGATIIFNRGLARYPKDANLNYKAAYHAMIDMHDNNRAAYLLSQAVANGSPSWMNALASRLYSESGQLELALRTLLDYQATMKGDAGRKDVETRIADIRRRLANAAKN